MVNELCKIKWILYLKDLVNKYCIENIFYYLVIIVIVCKDLNVLKCYIK